MSEYIRMMEAYSRARQLGEPVVLATIIAVRGSSYRPVGARMLILNDGSRIGALSGGCIEAELCRKAFWWTANGRPHLRTYNSTLDPDRDPTTETPASEDQYGLGCGGSIDIWLERIETDESADSILNPLELIQRVHARRAACVRAVFLSTPAHISLAHASPPPNHKPAQRGFTFDHTGSPLEGSRVNNPDVETADLQPAATLDPLHALDPLYRQLQAAAVHTLQVGLPQTVTLRGASNEEVRVYFDLFQPPIQLNIFGTGIDVQPILQLASQVGWQTAVCDRRTHLSNASRFSGAGRLHTARTREELAQLNFDAQTACIVMTHSFEQDRFFLEHLLPLGLPYLGVLGSRNRTETILAEINIDLASTAIYAPAGLNIGAESPETIAVSIIAEITACFAQRNGGFLRNHAGPIHSTGVTTPAFSRSPKGACLVTFSGD